MGSTTQVINFAAGFLAPAFRANRVRSLRDLGRLLSALGEIFYFAANSATAALRESCAVRIETLRAFTTKEALIRA